MCSETGSTFAVVKFLVEKTEVFVKRTKAAWRDVGGTASNRLEISTFKGNEGDWVSWCIRCLQKTELTLLESFLKMQVHQNGNFLQECVHFNKA